MISGRGLLNPKAKHLVDRALASSVLILAAVFVVLGLGGLRDVRELQSMRSQAHIDTRRSGLGPDPVFPAGLEAPLRSLSAVHRCTLARFVTSPRSGPFFSAFGQTGPGWNQTETSFRLEGATSDVVAALRDLPRMRLAFEFTSVDLDRVSASPAESAKIAADVSIRVLTPQGAAAR